MATFGCEAASSLRARTHPTSRLKLQSVDHTIVRGPTSSFVLRLALLLQLLGAVRIDALRASAPSAEENGLVQRVSPASSLAILMHTICYAGGQWHTNSHHAHGRCVVLRWTHCASKPRAQSCSW